LPPRRAPFDDAGDGASECRSPCRPRAGHQRSGPVGELALATVDPDQCAAVVPSP
jgi:hypothetical protein